MHVLVTCKNEDDRFKNEGASVHKISLTKMKRLLQGCSSVAATMQQSNMYATTGGDKVAN